MSPPRRRQIATPPVGKVLIEKGLIPLKYVKYFVLDEADKLLEPDLEYHTRSILKLVRRYHVVLSSSSACDLSMRESRPRRVDLADGAHNGA